MILDIVIQWITEVLSAVQIDLLNRIWKHINISYPTDFLFYYIFEIIIQPHHLSFSLPFSKPFHILLLPLSQIAGPWFSLIVITWLCVHILKYNLYNVACIYVLRADHLIMDNQLLWQHTFLKIYQNYLSVCLSDMFIYLFIHLLFWRIEMMGILFSLFLVYLFWRWRW